MQSVRHSHSSPCRFVFGAQRNKIATYTFQGDGAEEGGSDNAKSRARKKRANKTRTRWSCCVCLSSPVSPKNLTCPPVPCSVLCPPSPSARNPAVANRISTHPPLPPKFSDQAEQSGRFSRRSTVIKTYLLRKVQTSNSLLPQLHSS